MNISASVGQGGVNRQPDVRTVQNLLNKQVSRVPGMQALVVDGLIGPKTIGAIKQFQSAVVGFSMPDGRVDVNGQTWQALISGSGNPGGGGGHDGPSIQPVPGRNPGPIGEQQITLTVSHGNQIPTKCIGLDATTTTMYESTMTLSGGLSGQFQGSLYPKDMDKYCRIVDGNYPLHIGFHRGGGKKEQEKLEILTEGVRCGLLVNARNSVPVTSNNPGKTTAQGINVHNGFNLSRGTEGCISIRPSDWPGFISLFINGFPNINDWHTIKANTGKRIGTLIVKP
ncbi:MAG: peptidoglycan-binding domain-containing protein [Planctomycetota bacterium]